MHDRLRSPLVCQFGGFKTREMVVTFETLQFSRGNSRLIDHVVQLSLSIEAVFVAWKARDGADLPTLGEHVRVESKCLQMQFGFLVDEEMRTAIDGRTTDFIVVGKHPTEQRPGSTSTAGLEPTFRRIFDTEFFLYYERFAPWLRHRTARKPVDWPAPWNFAWVVRNAIVHDGHIRIDDPSVAPVEWGGVSVDPSSNGNTLSDFLSLGDRFALMLEMDAALDALGAPITV